MQLSVIAPLEIIDKSLIDPDGGQCMCVVRLSFDISKSMYIAFVF